jgi:hypothetical protein
MEAVLIQYFLCPRFQSSNLFSMESSSLYIKKYIKAFILIGLVIVFFFCQYFLPSLFRKGNSIIHKENSDHFYTTGGTSIVAQRWQVARLINSVARLRD